MIQIRTIGSDVQAYLAHGGETHPLGSMRRDTAEARRDIFDEFKALMKMAAVYELEKRSGGDLARQPLSPAAPSRPMASGS